MGCENFSRIDLETLCSSAILERGETYYREGHLIKVCRFNETVYGRLVGSGSIYQAKLHLGVEPVIWDCSCPYPDFCKHLAALALAWLEQPETFVLADEVLEQALAASEPQKLLKELVTANPFNLIELWDAVSDSDSFVSNRGLLNLVRNLFSRVSFRPDEAGAIWERVQNTGALLYERLNQADVDALEPFYELWEALLAAYQQFRDPKLKEVLERQFLQIPLILERFDFKSIHDLFDLFARNYVNPLLWELGPGFREALGRFIVKYPELAESFIALTGDSENYLELAACHELIAELPSSVPNAVCLNRIQSRLSKIPEGLLWLIDRLTAEQPDEAYHLAKGGLRSAAPEDKGVYREKLIHIHRIRLEFRQAAALSFLQFCDKPSNEEYIRLKEILNSFPHDFQNYHRRMVEFLQQTGEDELLIRILLRAGEVDGLQEPISKIIRHHETVMALIDDLTMAIQPGLLESGIYPGVIITALNDFNTPTPRKLNRLLAAYKKCCIQSGRMDLWQELTAALKERLGDYPDFRKRFGALLSN